MMCLWSQRFHFAQGIFKRVVLFCRALNFPAFSIHLIKKWHYSVFCCGLIEMSENPMMTFPQSRKELILNCLLMEAHSFIHKREAKRDKMLAPKPTIGDNEKP